MNNNDTITIKHKLADQMRNSMHIIDGYLPLLQCYKMVPMTGKEFDSLLVDGQIPYKFSAFDVIYHQCLPFQAKKAKEIRISFRAAINRFDIRPIALVQIVEQ